MYRGAGKSLARPGRKQANVSVRMAWISFGALPCRKKKKTWWQLASRCCWNRACPWHASELASFLVGLRTYQHPGILMKRAQMDFVQTKNISDYSRHFSTFFKRIWNDITSCVKFGARVCSRYSSSAVFFYLLGKYINWFIKDTPSLNIWRLTTHICVVQHR